MGWRKFDYSLRRFGALRAFLIKLFPSILINLHKKKNDWMVPNSMWQISNAASLFRRHVIHEALPRSRGCARLRQPAAVHTATETTAAARTWIECYAALHSKSLCFLASTEEGPRGLDLQQLVRRNMGSGPTDLLCPS